MREDNYIKQAVVAKELNIRQATYSRYETEQRTIPRRILIELAISFNTSIDYLFGLTDIKIPYERTEKIKMTYTKKPLIT